MEKINAVRQCVKYFLIFTLAPIMSFLILILIALLLNPLGVEFGAGSSFLVEIVSCCVIIGVCYLLEKRKKCRFINSIKLHKINIFSGVIYALLGLSAFIVFSVLMNLLPFFRESGGDTADNLYSAINGTELFFQFISKSIAVPIAEEIIFRGLMYFELKNAFSRGKASVAVSLLFAVLHFSVSAITVIVALVLGLFFNFLADRYNSIIPCILAHSTYNFASTFIRSNIQFMDSYGSVVSIVLICVFIITVIGVFYDIRKTIKKIG